MKKFVLRLGVNKNLTIFELVSQKIIVVPHQNQTDNKRCRLLLEVTSRRRRKQRGKVSHGAELADFS